MNLADALRTRRTVRRYRPEHPGRGRVEALIAAAVTAPSASNKQPWRFFATDDKDAIEQMARRVQEAVDRIAAHVEPAFREAFRAYGDYFVRFREAPVVIAAAYREIAVLSHMVDAGLGERDAANIREMELASGVVSASLAVQNLMLYAHSTGLGTSCMTGPLVALDDVKAALGVPPSWRLAVVVAVGFPDESPSGPPRKPVESVIRWVSAREPETLAAAEGGGAVARGTGPAS